jgi:ABC-2 type transport system permease protein
LAGALDAEPAGDDPQVVMRRHNIVRAIILTSPMELYTDALSMARFSGPLPLLQSILIVMPYIISLIALTVVCFAISYIVFMRQEIRSM